jgi:pimeloyl-ACP methyl ester carboxylesterase
MAQQIARSAMLASAKLGGRRAGSAMIVWRLADPIIPRRHALASPGHVGLHLVPDVGHLPQIEAPELRARPVRELIRAAA